jgi:hypothetical protein
LGHLGFKLVEFVIADVSRRIKVLGDATAHVALYVDRIARALDDLILARKRIQSRRFDPEKELEQELRCLMETIAEAAAWAAPR